MDLEVSAHTVYYVIAHADDWQLFMTPDAYYDLTTEGKQIVFIVTTAGDAGMEEAYWRAREEGMKSSILFCLKRNHPLITREGTLATSHGAVSWWRVNTIICYFLRLPDGCIHGEGYTKHQFASLCHLENGSACRLESLDGQIALSSWESFENLLYEIVTSASGSMESTVFKFLNPDAQSNPCDHSDHQCTGRAILRIVQKVQAPAILFKGYGSSCQHQLQPHEVFWKAALFAVYDNTVYERSGYSTLDENRELYQKWILAKPESERLPVTQVVC